MPFAPSLCDPEHNYWTEGYDGLGAFPPSKTGLMGLSQCASRGKLPTVHIGTPIANFDDPSVLTDGLGQRVMKFEEDSVQIDLDLGTPTALDVVGVLNTNADGVCVYVSNNADYSDPLLIQRFTPDKRVGWLDLRGFELDPGRYLRFILTGTIYTIRDTPVKITVAEVFAGTLVQFDGPIRSIKTRTISPRDGDYSQHGSLDPLLSEAQTRVVDVGLLLFADEIDSFAAVLEEAGLTGENFLFIPWTRKQFGFWLEWPEGRSFGFPNNVHREVSLQFVEEMFSIIGERPSSGLLA